MGENEGGPPHIYRHTNAHLALPRAGWFKRNTSRSPLIGVTEEAVLVVGSGIRAEHVLGLLLKAGIAAYAIRDELGIPHQGKDRYEVAVDLQTFIKRTGIIPSDHELPDSPKARSRRG